MKILTGLCLLLLTCTAGARTALEYIPSGSNPDPAVPTPESVLGWDVGDWHVSHDKLVQYMQALAEASPRVSIKEVGYTHEQRPLLQLAITSEANQQELESLRLAHLDGEGPLVVWLGYSVHGDEPSGPGPPSRRPCCRGSGGQSWKRGEILSGPGSGLTLQSGSGAW